jgi:hypothetical protein
LNQPRYNPEAPIPGIPYHPGITRRDPSFQIDHQPPPSDWKVDACYLHGVDLFNHGCYWEAHEAWEHRWLPLTEEDPHRTFLQGLIQAAAALLKIRLQDPDSASTIWQRGRNRLLLTDQENRSETYQGIELAPLITSIDQIVTTQDPTFEAPSIQLLGWP